MAIPTWFWAWAEWRLGRGPYKGHANDPALRPKAAPKKIPYWAWVKLAIMAGTPVPKPPKPKPIDPALVKARALLAQCRRFDGPYVYGGGHGGTLATTTVHEGLDCSSSTSKALDLVGLMVGPVAQVSTWFESYGAAGRGKYLTIHASGDHVWTEFTLPEGWFRFDTSPWGDGANGPRVRTGRRGTAGFVERHPVGY
jgi:hypothetical protein